jgi:molybdate transport system substrate-binding protein
VRFPIQSTLLKFLPALLGLLFNAGALHAAEVNLFAAASLSDVLKKVCAEYQRGNGDKVIFNFGASSLLARQIQEGAPADLFFSADEAKMDDLQNRELILKQTRRRILSNSLVLVLEKRSDLKLTSLQDLSGPQVKRLALAEPRSVPAGIYARAYLEKAGVWARVADKVILTENVRGALAAVEAGNAEAAIVYKTDALISAKVKVACEIPIDQRLPINYPVAVVTQTRNVVAATKLAKYFESPTALRTFEAFGFLVNR